MHSRFGFWSALGTAVTTGVAFGVALLTPPISGELCREGCIGYPYLEIAARFPRDYHWMFVAMVATLFYLALMVALHASAPADRRPMATFALLLGAMATLVLVGNYFVQLAVVQPSVLAGETQGLALLTQYNPHGLFIALEELGYVLMSLSLATMAVVLPSPTRLERAARWLFLGGLSATVLAFAAIALLFGNARGYRFEVAAVSINWLVLIVAPTLLAIAAARSSAAPAAR
jgi:hypothetical protein